MSSPAEEIRRDTGAAIFSYGLSHTGRPLKATASIIAIYVAAILGVVARLIAAFNLWREPMLHLSAAARMAAFAGFAIVFAPMLARPRS